MATATTCCWPAKGDDSLTGGDGTDTLAGNDGDDDIVELGEVNESFSFYDTWIDRV
ncbi:MAG: hypothetical protein CM1200mP2_03170 [Planctomycetaceae bacterium]|nr:MAG: hypothetical protein CM1200mP2_03170 [Planctomycetaceae bacterium]